VKPGSSVESFNRKLSGFLKTEKPGESKLSLFAQNYPDKYLHNHL